MHNVKTAPGEGGGGGGREREDASIWRAISFNLVSQEVWPGLYIVIKGLLNAQNSGLIDNKFDAGWLGEGGVNTSNIFWI